MSETTSIVAERTKSTENYAVYESAEVGGSQDLTGMYVSQTAFGDDPLDFIEVTIGDGDVTVTKKKDTANFGTYESESGAISGMYVSHDVLESEEPDEGSPVAPDELTIVIAPASEQDFEESQESEEMEEEASNLLSDAGSDDEVEVEETSEEEEAADLLEEAAEAAEQ